MVRPSLRLAGFSAVERNVLTTAVADAISAVGGWIKDVHFFSNIALTIRFEVPITEQARLRDGLSHTGLVLDPESIVALSAVVLGDPAGDVDGSIAITFRHDEPDLRRKVLAVPG